MPSIHRSCGLNAAPTPTNFTGDPGIADQHGIGTTLERNLDGLNEFNSRTIDQICGCIYIYIYVKLPQFIVLVSLTVGPQLPSWQSLFSHGLTCQGGCLPFAPWPQLLVHLQRWAAVRIEPLVGKAAEALLLVAAVEARLLRNIYIYIYKYSRL